MTEFRKSLEAELLFPASQLQDLRAMHNVLYIGEYEYLPGQKCKIVVCKRPDVWKLHYTNADIVNEAEEILCAFEAI